MLRRLIDRLLRKPEPPVPPAAPPALRNRPGGMAWIRGVVTGVGAEQLNNRAVKTVCLADTGRWVIEPSQHFVATKPFIWDGVLYLQGEVVGVSGVADECLEPWQEDGVTREEVRELYAPEPVPERV